MQLKESSGISTGVKCLSIINQPSIKSKVIGKKVMLILGKDVFNTIAPTAYIRNQFKDFSKYYGEYYEDSDGEEMERAMREEERWDVDKDQDRTTWCMASFAIGEEQ